MQTKKLNWRNVRRALGTLLLSAVLFTACSKKDNLASTQVPAEDESALVNEASALEKTVAAEAETEGKKLGFSTGDLERGGRRTIVQIALGNANLSSLAAAVVKTGLAGALTDASASLTVFAPTNAAFAQLPAPFNNAANIASISSTEQIDFLRNVLLYHVLGAEVLSNQIASGRSSAATLKPAGTANDNTVYISKTFGLIKLNGSTRVIYPNVNATNGVVHVIDKVLLFPTNTIAGIAIANPNFSTLVAALVKTNLAGVFGGSGDFTVFAPTNAAFAQLSAPFNNADNINAITDQGQIDALANILKYHVTGSRYFSWDLGILQRVSTIASAPNNKVTTILGCNIGYVKGDANNKFSKITPADILATNGVIQVIDRVLLPRSNN
ncbi:MAG TPA: fasciclin domain-containing protein [Ferruginibacter sp.]|nr:fasciclin domain-containing protein [Ferruginibacter sp.]